MSVSDDKIFAVEKGRVRILIADDEASIREMLGITLRDDGWNVDLAENGKVAWEKLQQTPYHIVLSDIQMPEMSGIELLENVKRKNPNIEVVIMTSNATLDSAVKALKSGAHDYLNKPFEDLSVVPRKMMQVAERILLRQQNAELLKRVQKSAKHLRLLFEATRNLNGILDLETLRKTVLLSLPTLFSDPSTHAIWLKRTADGWEAMGRLPQAESFRGEQKFSEPEQIVAEFKELYKPQVVRLEAEGEILEAFVFENKVESLADFFTQEVRTCFEKVMLHQRVLGLANRDGLTRLYNHRYFQDRLRQEFSQAKRQNAPLSIIMMDVDHFKKYNDAHGHPAGDQLLKTLSQILGEQLNNRESDIVARYGGEEFVMLLPFTPHEGAMTKAERIRAAVAAHPFEFAGAQPLGCVSMSIGVASFPDHGQTPQELMELADKALYRAKHGGRNAVASASDLARPAAPENFKPEHPHDLPMLSDLPSPEELFAQVNVPAPGEISSDAVSLPPPPPPPPPPVPEPEAVVVELTPPPPVAEPMPEPVPESVVELAPPPPTPEALVEELAPPQPPPAAVMEAAPVVVSVEELPPPPSAEELPPPPPPPPAPSVESETEIQVVDVTTQVEAEALPNSADEILSAVTEAIRIADQKMGLAAPTTPAAPLPPASSPSPVQLMGDDTSEEERPAGLDSPLNASEVEQVLSSLSQPPAAPPTLTVPPPPPAPAAPAPVAVAQPEKKPTLADVLQTAGVSETTTATKAEDLDISSLMQSIKTAFDKAETDKEATANKAAPATSTRGTS